MTFKERIKALFSKTTVKQWVDFIAMFLGLLVDVIALLSYIGFVNTPSDSPLFYINNQEFLVWSLIAVMYGLGFFNAKISERWKEIDTELDVITEAIETDIFSPLKLQDKKYFLSQKLFSRRYALALITSFPLTYLYIRAVSASLSKGTASPWIAFSLTMVLSGLVALFVLFLGYLFREALSFNPKKVS